jgi:predicted GTPase
MGPTGAGKSTVSSNHLFARFMAYLSSAQFIDIATGQNGHTVRHGLQSEKSEIRAVRVNHPKTDDPITFIDTPGLHDTSMSDIGILTMIAEWLVKMWV